MSDKAIRDTVRAKYGEAALRALDSPRGGCRCDPVTSNLYDSAETAALPEGAVLASLGCGNPTALAEVHEGDGVLDLKPGGRFAVSDVVIRGEVPAAVRRSMELWVGCVAGALEEQEYVRLLVEAGFMDVGVEPTRIYAFEDARAVLASAGLDAEVLAREVGGRIMGAFVRARKPTGVRPS